MSNFSNNMKFFGTQFKSLTANKLAYKALLGVFETLHVYRLVGPLTDVVSILVPFVLVSLSHVLFCFQGR